MLKVKLRRPIASKTEGVEDNVSIDSKPTASTNSSTCGAEGELGLT
jgi:hypothetical protein